MTEIRQATTNDLETVRGIVSRTINEVYPNYYPREVVDFFLAHHQPENILPDILADKVYLLVENGDPVGTGTADGEQMNRVFVLPRCQGKGYGSRIMDFLENKIAKKHGRICLDSSLPAYKIYLKRGYSPVEYHEQPVENGRILCYQVMVKTILR